MFEALGVGVEIDLLVELCGIDENRYDDRDAGVGVGVPARGFHDQQVPGVERAHCWDEDAAPVRRKCFDRVRDRHGWIEWWVGQGWLVPVFAREVRFAEEGEVFFPEDLPGEGEIVYGHREGRFAVGTHHERVSKPDVDFCAEEVEAQAGEGVSFGDLDDQ